MSVIDEIAAERVRQDEQWGGPDHDDAHSLEEFLSYIVKQLGCLGANCMLRIKREALVKAAALCVAAVEKIDRAEAIRRARLGKPVFHPRPSGKGRDDG